MGSLLSAVRRSGHRAPKRPNAISLNYLASGSLARVKHATFDRIAPAAGQPPLAEKRGAAGYAVLNSTDVLSFSKPTATSLVPFAAKQREPCYTASKRLATEPGSICQHFSTKKRGKAGYAAPPSSGLPQREQERTTIVVRNGTIANPKRDLGGATGWRGFEWGKRAI